MVFFSKLQGSRFVHGVLGFKIRLGIQRVLSRPRFAFEAWDSLKIVVFKGLGFCTGIQCSPVEGLGRPRVRKMAPRPKPRLTLPQQGDFALD